jgi:RNA polymerase sigma-70 factor, ECF subfamily
MPDERLIRRCQQHDPAAFAAMIDLIGPRTYRLAYRLAGNRHDALDMVQEAYETIWRKLPSLRSPEAFPAWYLQVTANACRDWLRRHRRAPTPISPDRSELPQQTAAEAPEQAALRREAQEIVQEAVRSLPPDYAVTVALHYQEGVGYRELAALLGVPARTVETRLRRAREMLRKRLRVYYSSGR